jgi:hypothetical protein
MPKYGAGHAPALKPQRMGERTRRAFDHAGGACRAIQPFCAFRPALSPVLPQMVQEAGQGAPIKRGRDRPCP